MVRIPFLIICSCFIAASLMKCNPIQKFHDDLPKEFEQYVSMDSSQNIHGRNVKMTLAFQSTEDIQSFITSDNQVIIYTISSVKENSFYKISPAGEIIDSLKLHIKPVHIVFVKGFIIDIKNQQYYTWGFDGNKKPIKMILQNTGLDWDIKKQREQISAIQEAPFAYMHYGIADPAPQKTSTDEIQAVPSMKNISIINYFLNKTGYQFSTTLDVSEKFGYPYSAALLLNNLFKRTNTDVAGDIEIIQSPFIKYRHFQKLTYEKVYFAGPGGNAGGYTKKLYHGILYTDVIFRNDTLRFKESMYLDEKDQPSQVTIDGKTLGLLIKRTVRPTTLIDAYMYYTNPSLDYALFSTDDRKVYMIK
ncbi:hypothetical protein SAMN06264346_101679 [Chryseobacterium profundimaris]|uniref:Lipoprotein n=1 Tax=Chryseobacterium profundimaris TaxID=1387275 RepID=A0ABY1NEE8_9FLAO|nr:hypothetical protein SAMN06264346_101679 [Chryseobacterium profundimaris]